MLLVNPLSSLHTTRAAVLYSPSLHLAQSHPLARNLNLHLHLCTPDVLATLAASPLLSLLRYLLLSGVCAKHTSIGLQMQWKSLPGRSLFTPLGHSRPSPCITAARAQATLQDGIASIVAAENEPGDGMCVRAAGFGRRSGKSDTVV